MRDTYRSKACNKKNVLILLSIFCSEVWVCQHMLQDYRVHVQSPAEEGLVRGAVSSNLCGSPNWPASATLDLPQGINLSSIITKLSREWGE